MDKKEIREAILAGEAALDSLEKAAEKLQSAKNWGLFDMLGGGMFSSFVKHSRIDEASGYMEEAKRKLAAFERELRDISVPADFSLELEGYLKAMDIFLDNVFVDVMVQSRLSSAAGERERTRSDVRGILTKLYPLLGEEERE